MMRIHGRRRYYKASVILLGAGLAALALLFAAEFFKKPMGSIPMTAAELECPGCNILLLTIDCLRADEIGRVGESGRKVMPNLARFAAKSLDFTNAYGVSSDTPPGDASIMTGLYPLHHAVLVPLRDSRRRRQAMESAKSLPGLLKKKGWSIRSLTLGWSMDGDRSDPEGALPRGRKGPFFTWVRDADHDPYLPGQNSMRALFPSVPPDSYPHRKDIANCEFMMLLASREGRMLPRPLHVPRQIYGTSQAARILRMSDPRQKLLAVRDFNPIRMDYYMAFKCFWTVFGLSGENRGIARDLYDAKAHEADARFGRILRDLRRRGDMDKTIIVVTSQHGEQFFEHGMHSHSVGELFSEEAHVPLLIHFPKLKRGRRVDALASPVDIEPTLLESLGLGIPRGLDGKSLLGAVLGKDRGERYVFSAANFTGDGAATTLVVRDNRFTYIKNWRERRGMYFDRFKDPGERQETTGLPPEAAARLHAALERQFFGARPKAPRAGDWPPWAGQELRKRLIRTGYW